MNFFEESLTQKPNMGSKNGNMVWARSLRFQDILGKQVKYELERLTFLLSSDMEFSEGIYSVQDYDSVLVI